MASFFTLLLLLIFQFSRSTLPFSLSVDDIIVSSPKATFTAGFYPVGQNAYTFSIWFTQPRNNIQNATVVWMANRDHPVNGKRSTLSLLKTGNLILNDAGQFVVWSTNTSSTKPLQLILHDSGNLVLQDQKNPNSSILWQSFDFPTNTLLPEQSLHGYTKLVSSRTETNSSSGFYKLFFDYDNVLRLLYEGPRVSSIYWPDPWLFSNQLGNTRSPYNSSRIGKLDLFGSFSSSDNFSYRTIDFGTVVQRRLTLDHDGNVRIYSRNEGEENWFVSGQFLQKTCLIHGICGPNSICSYDVSGRKCSCLPEYSWVDEQDWSRGCKSNFKLSCDNTNDSRFQVIRNVDFYGYDDGTYSTKTYKECEDLCLKVCECKGFQFKFSIEKSLFECYPKTQLWNGYHSLDFAGSIFLRLPKSSVSSYGNLMEVDGMKCYPNAVEELGRPYVGGKENGTVKFMLWFVSVLGAIELLGFFMVWCSLYRNSKHSDAYQQCYGALAAAGFRKFSYSELKQATKNFSKEIGRGAGGTVYKGVLSDNRVAAIKRLHELNQGESEFLAEVSIIGRLNHMNLIDMWGYCAEGKHRLLVYEYMENGTLADNLSSNALDWDKRYNIAVGTARGLAYLHEECLEWIFHCDIKPQNILIDSDYQPKVADFGLSKLLNREGLSNPHFSRIRGTRGYMAPEWIFNLQITSKVDVYSYGVVVLEMITGKSPTTGIEIREGTEPIYERLVTWVREKRRKGSAAGCSWVEQIVDPALGSNYDIVRMESLATVALDCVAEEKDLRPSMSQVVERLLSHEHDF